MRVKKFLLALLFICVTVQAEAALTFRDELLRLDGIVSADVIVQSPDKSGDIAFKEKYIAWFEQPVDWKNPDGEKFLQRAEIGFQGMDNVNVVYIGGYNLSDKNFPLDDRMELAKMYNANYISIEYRYFGLSMPEGLSDDVPAKWEHLTNENAANDFHNIMETLRGILSGTWVFTGTSKGGQTTNIFAYYFPKDADVYVPYVAPFCDTPEDPRLMEAVYTRIGNERYGEAKAKEYRDLLMNFIVEAVRERAYIQPRYYKLISDDLPYGSEDIYVSKDAVVSNDGDFEIMLADIPTGVWQYDGDFDFFAKILNMPERHASASADRVPYLRAMLRLVRNTDDDPANDEEESGDVAVNSAVRTDDVPRVGREYAYQVQVEKENGAYRVVLKYFREAVTKEGLTFTASDDFAKGYYARTQIKPNLLKTLTYDRTLRDNVIEWLRTTESKIIMVYGVSDPWYFVRISDDVTAGNPNVSSFVVSYGHGAEISRMDSEDKAAVTASLDVLLETDYAGDDDNGQDNGGQDNGQQGITVLPTSSGNCNFSGMGAVMISALFVLIRRKIHD